MLYFVCCSLGDLKEKKIEYILFAKQIFLSFDNGSSG